MKDLNAIMKEVLMQYYTEELADAVVEDYSHTSRSMGNVLGEYFPDYMVANLKFEIITTYNAREVN